MTKKWCKRVDFWGIRFLIHQILVKLYEIKIMETAFEGNLNNLIRYSEEMVLKVLEELILLGLGVAEGGVWGGEGLLFGVIWKYGDVIIIMLIIYGY